MEPRYGYATATDGVKIAYAVLGDAGRDVLVVPGMSSHVELYLETPFVRRIANFARVTVFDKRGTGMSDPVDEVPTIETRMEDIGSVMTAAGIERPILFSISEGAALAMVFAATYPERVESMILYGAVARATWAPDWPWADRAEDLWDAAAELVAPYWGEGLIADWTAPQYADDPEVRKFYARFERMSVNPAMLTKLYAMFMDVDVRDIVPFVHVPTLLIHRRGDRVVNVRAARWLAEHLPNVTYVELPGIDHSPVSDSDQLVDEIERFVTGALPDVETDRVLATVMFTDIVGSTSRASELGDKKWRELLEAQQRIVREQLERFHGVEVNTTGDGFVATFDGPERAIRCARAIVESVDSLGIDVRVGLHTGEIERIGDDVAGIAVHIAARVSAAAAAREVLVSETVKGIVAGSKIAFEERGEQELKGVPDRWRLFAVKDAK